MTFSKEDVDIIEKSPFFDPQWYIARYSLPFSAKKTSLTALHYLAVGWTSGKNPGPMFDGIGYSDSMSLTGVNPLLHYEKYGRKSKVMPKTVPYVQVKLYDVEFGKEDVYIALSADIKQKIYLSVGGKKLTCANDYPYEHQRCFDSFLSASGEKLLLFKATVSDMKNRIFVFTEDRRLSVELVIQNFINMYTNSKDGKFITVKNDSFEFTDRKGFVKYASETVKDNPGELRFLTELMKKRTKKYDLYVETLDNHNDNAYQMFLYDLNILKNNNAFFVTSKKVYSNESDPFLKSHYLVLNSPEFKEHMLCAKKIIVSWWCFPVYGYARSLIGYPFCNYDFYFVPHGISYDKTSYYLHYYNFGRAAKTYCCSEYEKKYLEECNGYKNVYALGYPRMDKWFGRELNENVIMLFPTWREKIGNVYLDEIYGIMQKVSDEFPQRRIVYAAHPSVPSDIYDNIVKTAGNISDRIICISPLENRLFNKYFGEAAYFITDYSSAAYDFSYKSKSTVIYYGPLARTDAKYELRPVFYEANCGITVENIAELLNVLNGNFDASYIEKRRKQFFSYIDDRNTSRVLMAILKS